MPAVESSAVTLRLLCACSGGQSCHFSDCSVLQWRQCSYINTPQMVTTYHNICVLFVPRIFSNLLQPMYIVIGASLTTVDTRACGRHMISYPCILLSVPTIDTRACGRHMISYPYILLSVPTIDTRACGRHMISYSA